MTTQKAYLIAGMGYGDEGKGTIVDWLTRESHPNRVIVVRYNGGAQAAHNVRLSNGKNHTFSQFGSGTLAGAETYLSKFMIANPLAMLREADALEKLGVHNPLKSIFIDENCLITTPYQSASNRLKEILCGHTNSSCGMGINETVQDNEQGLSLRVHDLLNISSLRKKLILQKEVKLEFFRKQKTDLNGLSSAKLEWNIIEDSHNITLNRIIEKFIYWGNEVKIVNESYFNTILCKIPILIFEGAQGILLDQQHGFFPYVTRSDVTFKNAESLLQNFTGEIKKFGISRSFQTRHGNGPFPSENNKLKHLAKNDSNCTNIWQGNFRVGELDLVTLKYAASILRLDGIIFTHLDCVDKQSLPVCYAYSEQNVPLSSDFFVIENKKPYKENLVVEIKPYNNVDIAKQLFSVSPLITLLPLKEVCKKVELPLIAESFGPTEKDKKWTKFALNKEQQ